MRLTKLLPPSEEEEEIMVATPAIRNLVRENKMHQARSLMEGARMQGMHTLDHALRTLYEDGLVSYEEALRYVSNPTALGAPPRELIEEGGLADLIYGGSSDDAS